LVEAKTARVRPDEVARPCLLPNGAQRIEIYGLDGRLHRSEEPDGSSVIFRYDIEGELRSVEHSGGGRVNYEGGSEQHYLRAQTDRCVTQVDFDENGFPARLTQRVDDFEWCVEYRRNEIGRVVACKYPQSLHWLQSTGGQSGENVNTEVTAGERSYFKVTVGQAEQQIAFADGTRDVQLAGNGSPLNQITCYDAKSEACVTTRFELANGRLSRAGDQTFEYDEKGRLAGCTGSGQALRYEYDNAGRLIAIASGDSIFTLDYSGHPAPVRIGGEDLTYDPLGRRIGRGGTKYRYNFFGQLTDVVLAGGTSIHYVYDGFGRLVARECGGDLVYYVVDFDGQRICEAAAGGQVRRSYLWQGTNCVADVDGVIGGPLSHSFHRGHGGRLHAIGLSTGELVTVPAIDPYGLDQLRSDGIPSFASLFADPATGLFHAGSRWFDPATAQFLTADGWFGTDTWNHMPPSMRRIFDALPAGTNVSNTPENAYAWCRYDPINYSDPNGHSAIATGFGLFFSAISFFLWQMQVTTIAFKMAALNFIIMLIPSLIDSIFLGGNWSVNIFNAVAPLTASSRLMVPWAFPLNGLYTAPSGGRAFTVGSVIWVRGSGQNTLEKTSKRDILVCTNAVEYSAAQDSVAANIFAVSRLGIKGTGTMDANAVLITAPVTDASVGVTFDKAFLPGDGIGIHKAGVVQDEFQVFKNFSGANAQLDFALPADFISAAIDFYRLDPSMVKIEKEGRTLARTITFIRENSIHFQNQLPEGFPESGLNASEYVFPADRKATDFTPLAQFVSIEFSTTDFGSYTPGDFLSILSGSTYFGRKMERQQGTRNVILDAELLPPAGGTLDPSVEVAVMTVAAEPPVPGQSSTGDIVTLGAIRTLRKHDGLTIAVGLGPVEDRRIVLQMFLRCTVDNLPADLQGKALKVDLLLPDVTRGNGTVTAADTVTVGKDQAKTFKVNQPARVTTGAGKEFTGVVKLVTAAAETIQFTENMPAADFAVNTAITIVVLKAFKTLDAEPVAAPGGTVDVKSEDLADPIADELLFVRTASGPEVPAARKVQGTPVLVAQVDSPTTSLNNLLIQTFTPDKAKTHRGKAKRVVIRLTPVTPPHPYVVANELYASDGTQEYIGKVFAVPGNDLILEDPPDSGFAGGAVIKAFLVEPTTHTTSDANLDTSLLAIPSDPDEDPVGRERAVLLHEMRHVWQYAVLGPFFFSQPLPWLVNLGFSIGNSKHKWPRWLSTGGLESLFSIVGWGIRGAIKRGFDKSTSANGTVGNAERTSIKFDAAIEIADLEKFTRSAPIEVTAGDNTTRSVIEKSSPNDRLIELRLPLEEEFPQGTAVTVSISPFEKFNSQMNDIFDLTKFWTPLLPATWARAVKGFMNRDNWFPFLGLYPIALLRAGGDQTRMYFEQDAAFNSGDLYTDFGVSYPNEVFVGEFSRVFAFISGRGDKDVATGVSDQGRGITSVLTVEVKNVPAGKTARELILGTTSAGGNKVRFRKEFTIPVNEKVENVAGAMFLSTTVGDYRVLSLGSSLDDMVDPALWLPPFIPFFPTSFNELRIVKVKAIPVQKTFTAADPLFETEETTFDIQGAKDVTYTIDYKGAAPVPQGTIVDKTFTAPRLAAGATVHNLAIKAIYDPNHDIFKGNGKLHGTITVPPTSLTNVCQDLDIPINPIEVNTPAGSVKAGSSVDFTASIAPANILRTSADIPEATVQADLAPAGGRPAKLRFRAPNKVNAAQAVTFKLSFGTAPNDRDIDISINVDP